MNVHNLHRFVVIIRVRSGTELSGLAAENSSNLISLALGLSLDGISRHNWVSASLGFPHYSSHIAIINIFEADS